MKNYLLFAVLYGLSQQYFPLVAMLGNNATRAIQFCTRVMSVRLFATNTKVMQPKNQTKEHKVRNQLRDGEVCNRVKTIVKKDIDYQVVVMAQELEVGEEKKLVAYYKCGPSYHARAYEDLTKEVSKMEKVKKQLNEVAQVAKQNGADDIVTWCASKLDFVEKQLDSVNNARGMIQEALEEKNN